jgi:hypothetical protein
MTLCVIHPQQAVKKSLEALLVASNKVDLTVSTESTEYIFTSLEDKREKSQPNES